VELNNVITSLDGVKSTMSVNEKFIRQGQWQTTQYTIKIIIRN